MTQDNIIIAPCANPSAPTVDPTNPCGTEPNDLLLPRLIVKPAYAEREVGLGVTFKAILWADGVETLLASGITWHSTDLSIAVIGALSGNATGVAPGIVTISVTYGDLIGTAQFEVLAVGACADQSTAFLVVVDNSKSSSGGFSGLYASRLDFAKEMARKLMDTIDFTKDSAVVIAFSGSAAVVVAASQDKDALKAGITSIAQTQDLTDIQEALQLANETTVTGKRVIVLLSDGEHDTGADPVPYSDTLRSAGVIIEVVGLRANGNGFRRLNSIATGGFFINALPSNQTSVFDWLSGMKGYVCAGNCLPVGDLTVGVGALNYDQFINWDVIAGHVDLIGMNPGGTDEYDFLPGNGLYLDGCGSAPVGNTPDLGTLSTKNKFVWTAGDQYRLTLRVAGNQREDRTPDVTEIIVYDKTGAVMASKEITITDFSQDFTDYSLDFVPTSGQAGGLGGNVVIRQKSIATGGAPFFGSLWDTFTLIDETTSTVLLQDNWDGENLTYIPPRCGLSVNASGYFGYCYSYGCLTTPLPAQMPDPAPLADLEGGTSTVVYNGSASFTAQCPNDASITATATGTATSDISQDDADRKAEDAAQAAASALLVCSGTYNLVATASRHVVPYPSVRMASGIPEGEVLVKVRLKIPSIAVSGSMESLLLILESPDFSPVRLMSQVGLSSAETVTNITFADSGSTMPSGGPLTNSTTYKPTNDGSDFYIPVPAPQFPYGDKMLDFTTGATNGEWKLWAFSQTDQNITISGTWQLELTTNVGVYTF